MGGTLVGCGIAEHRLYLLHPRRVLAQRLVSTAGAQRPTGDWIGAGGPADAQVDAAGVGGLEQCELLRDSQCGVVGQHHPT